MTTLTLEQCQKLKQLGFPQREGAALYGELLPKGSNYYRERFAQPNLEELIEWLGDDFLGLNPWKQGDLKWCARGVRVDISNLGRQQYYPAVRYKKTPLEAVYNLAIAIKQT